MNNPYKPTARTNSGQPKPKWRLATDFAMWCLTGIVFFVVGWPVGIAYALFYSANRKKLADKERLEANVHPCPQCGRELAFTSRICPRCNHRYIS